MKLNYVAVRQSRYPLRAVLSIAVVLSICAIITYLQHRRGARITDRVKVGGCEEDRLAIIGRALRRYATAHDGKFPDTLEDLVAEGVMDPAALNPIQDSRYFDGRLYICDGAKAQYSYVYLGKGQTLSSRSKLVILYDARINTAGFGGDGLFVLYLNGDRDWLLVGDAKRAIRGE